MEFADEIRAFSIGIPEKLEYVRTEEATKTALVLPFLRAMGYNTSDPREVVPEFTADFGVKKADRVDFAILDGGRPIMVIECKPATNKLDDEHVAQLFAYFAATETRFGVLTNGIVYRWYSDLDRPNQMDRRPFLEADLLEIDDGLIEELRRFSKSSFDLKGNIEAAAQLKYAKEIKRILSEELREPSDNFVRLFASQIYSGKMTQRVRDQFAHRVREAFNQFINDRVDRVVDRAKSSMAAEESNSPSGTALSNEITAAETAASDGDGQPIVTTDEERQAFFIVKSVLHGAVTLNRVAMRDIKSYCGILLDNNNRKPICRLWFNGSQKYLGLFDEQKQEERVPIDELEAIYEYSERLKTTVRYYDEAPSQQS